MTTLIINIRKLATEDTVLFPKIRDSLPEKSTQKDYHLRPQRLRRTTAARHASSSGQHALTGVEIVGLSELATSSYEGLFCRRRRYQKIITYGQHALTGVEIVGAVCLPTSAPLVGARRLGRQPPQVIRSSANFFMTLLVRLFFLDYFAQNGNHGGRIRYKLTGSVQNPKDAYQNRFVAWKRKGAVFKEVTSQLR
ncbi:hypothetical protein B0533_11560 [Sedimentibacter sp. SX930]|nr:hypothetical protein B0533_11560 [Sedimentibacter sp. SX930]